MPFAATMMTYNFTLRTELLKPLESLTVVIVMLGDVLDKYSEIFRGTDSVGKFDDPWLSEKTIAASSPCGNECLGIRRFKNAATFVLKEDEFGDERGDRAERHVGANCKVWHDKAKMAM